MNEPAETRAKNPPAACSKPGPTNPPVRGASVGTGVGVWVGSFGVRIWVGVAEGVNVPVGVWGGVAVTVGVGVWVGSFGVRIWVGVAEGVNVPVGVWVGVAVTVGVGVFVAVCVAVGVNVEVGC